MCMLRVCAAVGCETKTLGLFCIEHEGYNTVGTSQDLIDTLSAAVLREVYRTDTADEPRLDPRD